MPETDRQEYERGGAQRSSYSREEVVDVPCPSCGATSGRTLSTEHGAVGIKRCAECSLIYTSPRVREPEKVYWGDHDRYLAEARLIFAGRAGHHRDPNYREELDFIEAHRPGRGRLLDVGCNMGMLLRLARDRGWEAIGVEPSPALHRIATEQLGLEVHNCFVEDLPPDVHGTFDVVALSDVFEHVTQPRELLRAVAPLLVPGGLLYVKVPNARWTLLKQRLAALTRRRPAHGVWDAYEHVVHYTEETLREMLRSGGYEPLDVTIARPVQVPVWHLHVGHYYQYPSPWVLDPKRHLGRAAFHHLAGLERRLRGGRIGSCAQSLVAIARPGAPA
ncbi:MAG TPA: class I SAM-dependent methyltransferase [Solirubrobacteraceae bacterium]|nr:class I SAM-dependent methyltransferase [Solirubrobacteraceae bacterium]